MKLHKDTTRRIREAIKRYPVKRSAVLPLLHLVQEDQGYVSDEAVEWIASELELQPINVYELLTFYPMLRRKPLGKKHVRVCRTLSCALRGAHRTCSTLETELDCKEGEVSEDGEFSLEYVECQASCGTGPVVLVGGAGPVHPATAWSWSGALGDFAGPTARSWPGAGISYYE